MKNTEFKYAEKNKQPKRKQVGFEKVMSGNLFQGKKQKRRRNGANKIEQKRQKENVISQRVDETQNA